jgi:hypothetical protein
LENKANGLVKVSAAIYLFFALAFWPTWFCIAAWLMEADRKRHSFFAIWALLSTAWFNLVFMPAVSQLNKEQSIAQIREEHHSVWCLWAALASLLLSFAISKATAESSSASFKR